MARTIQDVRLDSKAARERLPLRKKPYYRLIENGRHVGYYRGPRGGTWLARLYRDGRYVEEKLAAADDIRDANGLDVLTFSQAQAKAPDAPVITTTWFWLAPLRGLMKGVGAHSDHSSHVEGREQRLLRISFAKVAKSSGNRLGFRSSRYSPLEVLLPTPVVAGFFELITLRAAL